MIKVYVHNEMDWIGLMDQYNIYGKDNDRILIESEGRSAALLLGKDFLAEEWTEIGEL